jgi:hypothetical protein
MTKRAVLVLTLVLSVALFVIGCGSDDEEETTTDTASGATASGATAETGAVGAVGQTLEVGETTFTVSGVKVDGNVVTVALSPSGSGEIVSPDNPLGATLIGGNGEAYKGQADLSTGDALTWEFDVPPEAQSGAVLELDQGGVTDTADLGID